ncbi:MAG: GNAT family N-acetyltransferase [archaeon]
MIVIKEADISYVPKIVDLWVEFMAEHDKIIIDADPKLKDFEIKEKGMGPIYEKFLRLNFESKKGTVFIAEADKALVGYILVFIKDEIPIYENKKVGYVSDLYVKEQFRHKGISSELMNKAIGWFKQKKLKVAAIPLYAANKHAYSIYKKYGFMDYRLEMRRKV